MKKCLKNAWQNFSYGRDKTQNFQGGKLDFVEWNKERLEISVYGKNLNERIGEGVCLMFIQKIAHMHGTLKF